MARLLRLPHNLHSRRPLTPLQSHLYLDVVLYPLGFLVATEADSLDAMHLHFERWPEFSWNGADYNDVSSK